MVLAISYGPLVGWYFIEAVGHNGTVHAKRPKNDAQRNGLGPANTAAYFGTLLLCRILPFQTPPIPNSPFPIRLLGGGVMSRDAL